MKSFSRVSWDSFQPRFLRAIRPKSLVHLTACLLLTKWRHFMVYYTRDERIESPEKPAVLPFMILNKIKRMSTSNSIHGTACMSSSLGRRRTSVASLAGCSASAYLV